MHQRGGLSARGRIARRQGRGARLAVGVDAGADHRCPVVARERQEAIEPGTGGIPILQVHRVEDGPPAYPLEGSFGDRSLGGVDDEGDRRLGGKALRHFCHVPYSVGACVVDAHVEQMGALTNLVACHRDRGLEVAREHRVAEALGSVGVCALAYDQKRRLLLERCRNVQRSCRRLINRRARCGHEIRAGGHDLGEVLGGRAATTADDRDPQFADEQGQVFGEGVRRQVVVHLPVEHRRQSGIRQRRDRSARLARQEAEGFVHLDGTGGAIHADHVGSHRVQRAQCRADLGAEQHPAGELDGHLHLDRYLASRVLHGAPASLDRRLGLEHVVDRLDQEEIDSAVEQPTRDYLVGVPQVLEAHLAERRQLRAWTEAPGNIALPVWGRVAAGDLFRQTGGGAGQFLGAIRDLVLGEHDGQRPERVRLDDVDPDLEKRPVQLLDDGWTCDAQHLVAALERLAAEVVGAQLAKLEVGAGSAVVDHDAFADSL